MKKTVLKYVQNILSAMDSDNVNSIHDTVESYQVANALQTIFEQIVDEYDIPAIHTEYQLEGGTDTDEPTRLEIPDEFMTCEWIKYDVRNNLTDSPAYTTIPRINPEQFINRQANLNTDPTLYKQVTLESGVKIRVRTDHAPTCWTSFNNKTIIFDGYNKNVESTVMASKTICYGQKKKEIILEDTHEVDLPKELSLLLELNTLEYSYDLWKGSTPAKIVHLARKARVRAQRSDNKFRDDFSTGPDYGRTSTGRRKPNNWGGGGGTGSPTTPPVVTPPTSSGGVVNFVATSYAVDENGQLQVQLERTGGTSGELIVRVVSTPALTNPTTGLVSWADTVGGIASVVLQALPVSTDTPIQLSLSVVSGTGVLGTINSIPVMINDTTQVNPGAINSSISAVSIPEGSTFVFTLTRDGGTDGAVSCPWGIEDGGNSTLISPSSGTAVWLDGENAPISYVITASAVTEDSYLNFGRGTPVGASQGTSIATYSMAITKVAAPGYISLKSATPISIDEATSTNVIFSRVGGSDGVVSARYLVENNLAVPSVGRVEWQDGDFVDKTVSITATNVSGTQTSRIVLDDPRGGALIGFIDEVSFTVVDRNQGFVSLQPTNITSPESTQITIQASRYGGKDGAVTAPYSVGGSLALPATGAFEWEDQEDGLKEITLSTISVNTDTSNTVSLGTPTGGLQLGAITQFTLSVEDSDVGVLNMSALASSVNEGSTITLTVTRDNGSNGAASCDWVFPGFTPSSGSFTWADGNADNKTEVLTANYIYADEDQIKRYGHLLNITGASNGGTIRRDIEISWVSGTKNTTPLTVFDSSTGETLLSTIDPMLPGADQKVLILMDYMFPAGQDSLATELAYLPNQAHLEALGTTLETAGVTEAVLDIEYTGNVRTAKWDHDSLDEAVVRNCAAMWVQVMTYIRNTYTGTLGIYGGATKGLPDYAGFLTNPTYTLTTNASQASFVANKYKIAADNAEWMFDAHDAADFLCPSIYANAFQAYNDFNTGNWDPVTGDEDVGFRGPYYWARSEANQKVIDAQFYRFVDYLLEEKHPGKRKVWYISNDEIPSPVAYYPDGIMEWQMDEVTQYTGDEIAIWSSTDYNATWPAEDIQEYTNYTGLGYGTINIALSSATANENTNTALTLTVTRDGGSLDAATALIGCNQNGNFVTPTWYLNTFSWADGNDDTYTVDFSTLPVTTDTPITFLMASTTGAAKGTPDRRSATILNVPQRGTLNLTDPTAISGNEQTDQTFTVLRTGGTEGEVGCTWTIARASGVQLVDTETGTVTFPDGVASQDVTVRLSAVGATVSAGNYLTISSPTGGAVLGATTTGTVSVTDTAAVGHGILNLETTAPTGTVGGTFDIRVGRDNTSGSYTATSIPWSLSGGVGTPASGTFSWGASPDNADKTQTITCTNAGTGSILLGTPTGSATRGVFQGSAVVSAAATTYTAATAISRAGYGSYSGWIAPTPADLPVITSEVVVTPSTLATNLVDGRRVILSAGTYPDRLLLGRTDSEIVLMPGAILGEAVVFQDTALRVRLTSSVPRAGVIKGTIASGATWLGSTGGTGGRHITIDGITQLADSLSATEPLSGRNYFVGQHIVVINNDLTVRSCVGFAFADTMGSNLNHIIWANNKSVDLGYPTDTGDNTFSFRWTGVQRFLFIDNFHTGDGSPNGLWRHNFRIHAGQNFRNAQDILVKKNLFYRRPIMCTLLGNNEDDNPGTYVRVMFDDNRQYHGPYPESYQAIQWGSGVITSTIGAPGYPAGGLPAHPTSGGLTVRNHQVIGGQNIEAQPAGYNYNFSGNTHTSPGANLVPPSDAWGFDYWQTH